MKVNKNPYSSLVNLIREHGAAYNPPSIMIGEIVSDEPISVKIGDIEIPEENLLISDFLLKEYKREMTQEIRECTVYDKVFENIPDSIEGEIQYMNNYMSPQGPVTCSMPPKTKISLLPGKPPIEEFESESTMTYTDGLAVGDTVVVMPTYDMQKFIVLARVVSKDENTSGV